MFKDYSIFESNSNTVTISNYKRAMLEILTSICILNPEFLTGILEGGYKKRYTLDNISFITDVKSIILNNNTKFKIGVWDQNNFIWKEDKEISKIHYVFNNDTEFDVEKNWNILVKADKLAGIIKQELDIKEEDIKKVYWAGLDVFSTGCENIIIETEDQKSICLKNIFGTSFTKNANDILSELFNVDIDVYKYEDVWNTLSNEWINLLYNNVNIDYKKYMLEWLDVQDIKSISYNDYMKIKHPGKYNQKLGKHVPEFNKNIILFRDLCKELYINRETVMEDSNMFDSKWLSIKDEYLNSRLLEHLFIDNLKNIGNDGLYYMVDGSRYKTSTGEFKNNIITLLLDNILNTGGKEVYVFSENGKQWTLIPSDKSILEDDNIMALYKYHTDLNDDDHFFELDIWIGKNEENIIQKMLLGKIYFDWFGEMSNKLKCKLSFDYNIKEV